PFVLCRVVFRERCPGADNGACLAAESPSHRRVVRRDQRIAVRVHLHAVGAIPHGAGLGLAMPRRHVDCQPVNLPALYRVQMFADRLDVFCLSRPAGRECLPEVVLISGEMLSPGVSRRARLPR
ncbi:MAG: hypothetical protein ACRCWS_00300, partial [Propionibacteriaceae bacterium]